MSLREVIAGFRNSFHFKLFAIFTLLTALAAAIFTLLYITAEIKEKRSAYGEKARILATSLAENARLPLYAENRDLLLLLISDAMGHPEIYNVVISTANNKIIANLQKQKPVAGKHLISSTVEVFSVPHGESAESALTPNSSNTRNRIGSVFLELAPVDLPQLIRNTIIKAFSIALAFWAMVAVLANLALRKAIQSFTALMQGIEAMRAGNFAARIDVNSDDEPGRAALAVNELAASLQERDRENARLHEELVNALRLEVQEEKKQLMAKLIQTNRMTSLGLLASSMAHEINNPNGSISLANQYMGRACKDALPLLQQIANEEGDFSLGGIPFSSARQALTECSATIERSTTRISHVIKDLRAYSLGERNEFTNDVDIKKVISAALTIVRSHGKYSGMNFLSDVADEIPAITGSQNQLEQVLINLFLNAIQATPDGKGQITINSSFDNVNNQVVISVRDNGKGIPPENIKLLLEPFFSTNIDSGGSGLGLFVTSFIINEHNGRLEFDSTPGVGTTVTISLPVSHDTQQA